ncbi:tetratricopeptide repeat protein [Flavobacterium sp. ANB]|uniref:tetratricopeptide repeat-containing sensor histidine kinase n=1 Tax=unclassified Flavobacterium TaxID=196869 RepID=UPI0012B8D955|nr:tetratricopeptide repeat protein [Flavobacterium sp. ANB]MBF4515644.1 tetratricopeptide repeat protein [Flavobacterium sp. ANB]MTD68647.1 tetratricopeptide repeat protein [Flavobacterium sp. LC2016-13]
MNPKFRLTVFLLFSSLCSIVHAQSAQIDSLQHVLRIIKADTAKVNHYNTIADLYKEINPDSTLFYAQKAAVLSTKTGYNFGLATAFMNKGNASIILGNYPVAIKYFKNAQTQFEIELKQNPDKNQLKKGLARAYASSGVVYSEQSNYTFALKNFEKALKLYQEIQEQLSISKVLNNIGIVYKSQLIYPKALYYLKEAHKIQLALGEENAPMTLTNIGVIYFEMGEYQNAIQYYEKAKKGFEKNNNKRGFALLNNYLGDYYKKQNNKSLALDYYQKSLNLYEEIQNKFGASLSLFNIGSLLQEQQKYSEALPFAIKSLAYAKEIGVQDQTFHTEKLLSELYESLNDSKAALTHYKNYIIARDSINNQETNNKFARAEMNYEFNKKEALLSEEHKRQIQFVIFSIFGALLLIVLGIVIYNRMQVKRQLTLKKEVAEYEQKALHLQMNPHFVFNCLSSISSFIVQNGTDSALKYLSKFSKLMRLTLEYSKGSLIPIDKEIESLQNYLELEQLRFHDKFEFDIQSTENVEFNMGLPPLLIQPFVENAILHGMVPKEGKGKISVNFDVQNQQLVCTITDDGIGLSESKLLKENSVTAHQSMALDITKKRLKIMESITSKSAKIEIIELNSDQQKTGTKVTLFLPIQYIP